MNKNTKQIKADERKKGQYSHGKTCDTSFGAPGNKRKRPYAAPSKPSALGYVSA